MSRTWLISRTLGESALTIHAFQLGQVFTTEAVMFGAVGTGITMRRDLTS